VLILKWVFDGKKGSDDLPYKRWAAGSISALGGFYAKPIMLVLGTVGFLISCLPSLLDCGMLENKIE
jgi:hypothetical protein